MSGNGENVRTCQIKNFLYTLLKWFCPVLALAIPMVALSASASYGAECGNPQIVFAFQGNIFAASGTGKLSVSEIASGFRGPYEMTWAPDCGEFAFLDAGSLWIAAEHQTPFRLQIPGQVSSFVWSPNSKNIGVTAKRSECVAQSQVSNPGDVFTVSLSDHVPRMWTQNCRSYLDGWSSDNQHLLLEEGVTYKLACDPSMAPCAGTDLMIADIASGSIRTLLSAKEQTKRGYSIGSLVRWEAERHTIYMSNGLSPSYGDSSILVAIGDTDGQQLWSQTVESSVWLGDQQFEAFKPIGSTEGFTFQPVLINEDGRQTRKYPIGAGALSPDKKYVAGAGKHDWITDFIPAKGGKGSSYSLPAHTETCTNEWTPDNRWVINGYTTGPTDKDLEVSLWVIDPESRKAENFFHQTLLHAIAPNANPATVACGMDYPPAPPIISVGKWYHR
ncbi:MAG TPA: hypothetical protein VGR94_11420 [Candidatus Acidoferrales bacterium]|nr:hypothetical protein [Candidatus Acidoferrales bacterium]